MEPLSTSCHTTYHAKRNSGVRDPQVIRWIVMHDTEGGTAKSIAAYFASDKAKGSAHLVVDDATCYRTLGNEEIPWAAPGANTKGFHIEQVGYAKWSLAVWKKHLNLLKRSAYKAAYHCHKFGIPPLWVDAKGLREGLRGVTSHAECTKAFGGDHTDPGPFWPRRIFMSYVQKYYAEIAGV